MKQGENKSTDQDSLGSREECKEIWNTFSFKCVSLSLPTHVLKTPLMYSYAIWSVWRNTIWFNYVEIWFDNVYSAYKILLWKQ